MVLLGWTEAAGCDTRPPCPLLNGSNHGFWALSRFIVAMGVVRVAPTHFQVSGFCVLVSILVSFDALEALTRILGFFCVPFLAFFLSPLVFLLCSSPTYNASPPPLPAPNIDDHTHRGSNRMDCTRPSRI